MMLFADTRPRRKPSLTPLIDVVFLLLVFFMLASRFGMENVVPLPLAGGGSDYSGPPRLVDIGPDSLRINGIDTTPEALPQDLAELTETPADTIVLRGRDGADLQRVIGIADGLRAAGFTALVLVE
ncbi:biopolymer transporter ExbD [Oceanicola sp. 22II-s10i]|uniref:ExbD/TolR family protein n=1 Tax=Oceanicola sp. 22II-s10i TaxID=1317116 RepID=UPI000B520A7B|nr:biopolymer transporter ExbD [Oceanicola sp. 22II-s10i]